MLYLKPRTTRKTKTTGETRKAGNVMEPRKPCRARNVRKAKIISNTR